MSYQKKQAISLAIAHAVLIAIDLLLLMVHESLASEILDDWLFIRYWILRGLNVWIVAGPIVAAKLQERAEPATPTRALVKLAGTGVLFNIVVWFGFMIMTSLVFLIAPAPIA